MMGYGYDGWGMMGGFGAVGVVTWVVATIDLVLLGIWLWQKIKK